MLTPEFIEALRQSLPPLSASAEPPAALHNFNTFYGIDFAGADSRLRHRAGYVPSGNFQLMVQCWEQGAARTTLLVVHGYLDHTGLFGHLIDHGLKRGCNVVALDLPGHGLSSGEPAVIDDFADYSAAVRAVVDAVASELPWQVIGQSTGCAALIGLAQERWWPFEQAVFLAPLIRPASWRKVNLAWHLLHRFRDGVPRDFARNSSDETFLAFVREDPLQSRTISVRWVGALRRWLAGLCYSDLGVGPLLVVQGDADGTVDWRYNMRHITDFFPACDIVWLPGAGHQLANESEALRRGYLARVDTFMGWDANSE